jgi:hypothetical protein
MTPAYLARRLAPMMLVWGGVGCQALGPDDTSWLCESAVTIVVGQGTQPTLDWQPFCGATSVSVVPVGPAPQLPLWQATPPTGGIEPPLRVGSAVPGATVWGEGASLTLGAAYMVYVVRGRRGEPNLGVDSVQFTAQP